MPGEAPMLSAARWRTAQDSMRVLLETRTKHYSLAQPFYTDAGFFEVDLQAIFYRRWLFAGDPPHPELAELEAEGIGPGPFDGIDLETPPTTPSNVLRWERRS